MIESLVTEEFARIGNSSFRLQASKFNGYLYFGISKFFQPKNSVMWLPSHSNCWMKASIWDKLNVIVSVLPIDLRSRGIIAGM
jgi:hypothetical protein